jgi:HEAT repeat protein
MSSSRPDPKRSSEELIRRALAAEDDETRWELVQELQRRGTRREFELARALFEAGEEEQQLACDILGQLGFSQKELGSYPYGTESAPLLARALRSPSPALQHAAIMAAGHLRWETLIPAILELAKSPEANVRYAVAFALGGRTDDPSVKALIALSDDADEDVRNWATFGLGTQSERRDALVRDALARRIQDSHPETRGEAWAGLAAKGDDRAVKAVQKSLESETLEVLAIEAAESYARPAFIPALERWLSQCQEPEDEYFRSLLESALAACRAKARN